MISLYFLVSLLFILKVSSQNTIPNKNILPYTIIPLSYDLKLTPYFENGTNFTFEGDLVLNFKPVKHYVYSSIVVHMDNITISSVSVSSLDGSWKQEDILSADYDPDSEWYNVTVSEPFSVDKVYRLKVKYVGVIRSDRRGFYRSTYLDGEGNTRWLAVTQLRPIFARRLLPCLDEPRYKATFKLSVWILPQYVAVSNMPVKTVSPIDRSIGRVLVTFKTSPRMSPFLLALAVFDFASLTSNNHPYSTWAVPSKIKDAELAQQMAPKIIHAMEELTASKFMLPKMDQIALPDLEPVAMENWGMNTYKEINILYEVGKASARQLTNVPRFTGHEVAHYWIGNSVTIAWWDWLWISEGFAMYLEYYLPHQVEPSWRMLDQLVIELIQPGLLGDSLPTSVPLTTHVETRNEIVAKFSGLTYSKGPALIRMVEHFLTSAKFKIAFRKLLRNKALSTVTPSELWSFFSNEGATLGFPETVTNIMATWTDKPGYPVVTVTREYKTSFIRLTQERFLQEGSSNETLWWIPLSYTSKSMCNFNDTKPKVWLCNSCNSKVIQQKLPSTDWIIFNLQLSGFYRVNYDITNWNLLISQLKSDKTVIHVLNRAQLIDDAMQLARARLLPYNIVFNLLTYLKSEIDYIPWSSAFNGLDFLNRRLTGYPVFPKFKKFIKEIVTPLYKKVGFEELASDNHMIKLVRIPAVTWACSNEIEDCRCKAGRTLESFISGNEFRITPGLEAVTLCTAVEKGGEKEWLFVQNISSIAGATAALACSSNQSIIAGYLLNSITIDSETIWSQKLGSVLSHSTNINTAFNVFVDNIEPLRSRFGVENVKKYISQIGGVLTTRAQMDKLKVLLSQRPEGLQDVLKAVEEILDKRLAWLNEVYPTIEQWFTGYNK